MSNINFRVLVNSDFNAIKALEYSEPIDLSIMIPSTDKEILASINSELSIGVFDSGVLVGYTLAYLDAYEVSVFVEKSFIRSDHRGKKYQLLTMRMILEKA